MAGNDKIIVATQDAKGDFNSSRWGHMVPDKSKIVASDDELKVLESGMRRAHEYKGANDNGDGVERNACGDAINPKTGLPKVNLDQAFKF